MEVAALTAIVLCGIAGLFRRHRAQTATHALLPKAVVEMSGRNSAVLWSGLGVGIVLLVLRYAAPGFRTSVLKVDESTLQWVSCTVGFGLIGLANLLDAARLGSLARRI